jgi:PTS system galactitol-specific IIB component
VSRLHKIVVACGTAIATSTHVAMKVQEVLEERGFQVHIVQCRVAEVPSMVSGASVVVATAQVPFDLDVPVINGLGFLTGVGLEEVIDQIEARLREVDSYTDTEA